MYKFYEYFPGIRVSNQIRNEKNILRTLNIYKSIFLFLVKNSN